MSKVMGVFFILIVAAMFIIMYMFSMQSIATTEMNLSITNTQYAGAYNDSVNASKIGFSFLSFAPMLLGVAGLLGALFLMLAAVKVRN